MNYRLLFTVCSIVQFHGILLVHSDSILRKLKNQDQDEYRIRIVNSNDGTSICDKSLSDIDDKVPFECSSNNLDGGFKHGWNIFDMEVYSDVTGKILSIKKGVKEVLHFDRTIYSGYFHQFYSESNHLYIIKATLVVAIFLINEIFQRVMNNFIKLPTEDIINSNRDDDFPPPSPPPPPPPPIIPTSTSISMPLNPRDRRIQKHSFWLTAGISIVTAAAFFQTIKKPKPISTSKINTFSKIEDNRQSLIENKPKFHIEVLRSLANKLFEGRGKPQPNEPSCPIRLLL